MRPPEFWKADAGGRDAALMLRALLTPVSWAYAAIAAHRYRTTVTRHAPVPVVCIGNLTVGGAGKTPLALAIEAMVEAMECRPAFLTRGYGGSLAGPHRVDPDRDSAADVGDEPLLLARAAPTIVARERLAGAKAIEVESVRERRRVEAAGMIACGKVLGE